MSTSPRAIRDLLTLIGARYQRAREAAGVSQGSAAARAGLSRSSVANFEAGRQDVPLSKVIALCIAVDMPLDGLLREGHPPRACG